MVGPYTLRGHALGGAGLSALAIRAALVVWLAVLPGACRSGADTATLSDLGGVDELKARFNRDAGQPRIVLLLSPT